MVFNYARIWSILSVFLLWVSFVSASQSDVVVAPDAGPSPSKVSPLMHRNFQALLKLQQFVANPEEFNSSKNAEEIEENLATLADVGKTLPHMISKEKPGLTAISELFSGYIANAHRNFKSGYKDYARHQVKTIAGYCMACHTSGNSALQFKALEALPGSKEMNLYQKADFYAATRQFDKALETYERIVFDEKPSTEKGLIDMSHAIRSYLSISVRVRKDAKLTYGFLVKVSDAKNTTKFFEHDLAQWKLDTVDWVKERKIDPKSMTTKALLAKSKILIDKARRNQLFPADHTGDVQFLRASVYAHEAIDKAATNTERADAFYMLGRAYSALSDPFLWELDGLYFEACIRSLPHSTLSKQCFKQLASGIYLGYSGSGGVIIPEDDIERLAKLRKLAE